MYTGKKDNKIDLTENRTTRRICQQYNSQDTFAYGESLHFVECNRPYKVAHV